MLKDNFKKSDYPLIVFKENDSNIYIFKKHFGVISKGGEFFYDKLIVINVHGEMFYSNEYKINESVKFLYSLLYFQKMYKLDVFFNKKTKKIPLTDLKKMIKNHVIKNPNKWIVNNSIEIFKQKIEGVDSYYELILLF